MKDYYYYIEDKKLNRFRIERDDDPWSPREDMDGNVGHMACFHRDYNFSDSSEKEKDPDKFLDNLIRKTISEKTLINLVRKGKIGNLEIKYNRSDKQYELLGDYKLWGVSETKHGEIASAPEITWLYDDILDAISIADKLNILEKKDYYFLPLAIYDHSGVTMWVGSRWNHFDAQWDCSDVGWIYTTKKEVLDTQAQKVNKKNWKKAADEWMRNEIDMYDMYLVGDVYGFINEEWDGDDWNEDDSCWGFYSRKWGDELAREIANDGITGEPFITETEVDEFKKEFKIMQQAETMFCLE